MDGSWIEHILTGAIHITSVNRIPIVMQIRSISLLGFYTLIWGISLTIPQKREVNLIPHRVQTARVRRQHECY